MAYKGNLFIAGTDSADGRYVSGIALTLSATSPISYLYNSPCGEWQVEFISGINDVAARTTQKLSREDVLILGFEQVQRALDILSVRKITSIITVDPTRNNVGVCSREGNLVLFHYALHDFSMGLSLEVKMTDSEGNNIPTQKEPEPIWSESFRYYRLSQSSSDLFEAYRNLFLGFEALLNEVVPKKRKEREGVWFKRSLSVIHEKIDLTEHLAEAGQDPVAYIIKSQYKDIRCRLLHAKLPEATLPHSIVNPVEVKQAYEQLLRIWRHIAGHYFDIPNGGGVITYIGFENFMSNALKGCVGTSYTEDSSPPSNQDDRISPTGLPVYDFSQTDYLGACNPGVVRVFAREKKLDTIGVKTIYRVCVNRAGTLFSVAYLNYGLKISGVDEWESISDFRLINSTQPSTEFKT
ncbi:hypothetical protein NMR63_002581 [Vibrio cholerae]|uniref:hypothetical protein n=1 Tax=Vibrio TaxID=662 RepID=UPI00084D80DD